MTTCPECGLAMTAAKGTYAYQIAPGFVAQLRGITILHDENDHVAPSIPNVLDLNRFIAEAVLRKPGRLTGAEFRFLRSRLGLQAMELAAIMGASTFTLSRWEREKEPIGSLADRLVRALVVLHDRVESFDLKTLAAIDKGEARPLELEVRFVGGGWRLAAIS